MHEDSAHSDMRAGDLEGNRSGDNTGYCTSRRRQRRVCGRYGEKDGIPMTGRGLDVVHVSGEIRGITNDGGSVKEEDTELVEVVKRRVGSGCSWGRIVSWPA